MTDRSLDAYADLDLADATAPARRSPAPGRSTMTSRLPPVRRRADGNGVADGAEVAVQRAASSSQGAPLAAGVRERFEASLGADLSGVRVHTGSDSAAAASAVGARAYTVGNDIHFGAGQYGHDDPFGLHLLAHEVAHTQQQAAGSPHRQHKLAVSTPGDAAEVEADRAADAMIGGAAARVSSHGDAVQRKEQEGGSGDITVQGTVGDDTYGAKFDKNGHPKEVGREHELFSYSMDPYPICPEPPLFLGAQIAGKIGGSIGDDAEPGTPVQTTGTIEVTGSILMGVAKKGLGKVGIEGSVVGTIGFEAKARVSSGGLKVDAIDFPIDVKINIALVGEVGEGHKKVGGSISKNLGALRIGNGHWDGNHFTFEHCSLDDVGRAAKELLANSADTLAMTSPVAYGVKKAGEAIDRHQQDAAAQKQFDASLKNDTYEMKSDQEASFHQKLDAYAPREEDCHKQYTAGIETARAECERYATPFNTTAAKDPTWWKHGADTTYNEGTVHRMKGNQAVEAFKVAEGTSDVQAAASRAIDEYHQASLKFRDASLQQFGR